MTPRVKAHPTSPTPMETTLPSVPADLRNPLTAAAGLHVFFAISAAWGLTRAEQGTILGVDGDTLDNWVKGAVQPLVEDTLVRLSLILGIYASLHTLLPIPERADAWIRRSNRAPMFKGGTALERMMTGKLPDLAAVRQYLEAQCSA